MNVNEDGEGAKKRRPWVLLAVLGGVGLILLLAVLAVWQLVRVKRVTVATTGTVTLGGTTYAVVSEDSIRKLGLPRNPVRPEENAAPVYLQAFNLMPGDPDGLKYHKASWAAREGQWNPKWKDLEKWLKGGARAREKAREAMSLPKCQFPFLVDATGEWRGFGEILLPVGGMQGLAVMFVLEGARLHHEGRPSEALTHYLACYAMSRHLAGDEPYYPDCADEVLCLGDIGTQAIARFLQRGKLAEAELVRLGRSLAEARRLLPDCQRALDGQRIYFLLIVDELANGVTSFRRGGANPASLGLKEKLLHLATRAHLRVVRKQVRAQVNAIFQSAAELARLPPAEAFAPAARAQLGARLRSASPWAQTYPLGFQMQKLLESFWSGHARLDGLRIMTALMLHKARKGKFPERLPELVPGELDKLPLDPFTGKDFVYRLEMGSFVLYSVGPNLYDDGSEARPSGSKGEDIVFTSGPIVEKAKP